MKIHVLDYEGKDVKLDLAEKTANTPSTPTAASVCYFPHNAFTIATICGTQLGRHANDGGLRLPCRSGSAGYSSRSYRFPPSPAKFTIVDRAIDQAKVILAKSNQRRPSKQNRGPIAS